MKVGVDKVVKMLAEQDINCVVIKDRVTIRYLTGFTGDAGVLYFAAGRMVLITDGRFTDQAKSEAPDVEVVLYSATIWDSVRELVGKAQRIGFDGDYFSYKDYCCLFQQLQNRVLISLDFSFVRAIKTQEELDNLQVAAQIADEAFRKIIPSIRVGCKEREIAVELEYQMCLLGSQGASFDTIVASGERSAMPHGVASEKTLQKGDFVTFDFGAVYKGYHSDMTRTLVMGKADAWHHEIYDAVLSAQKLGLQSAKSGMPEKKLDKIVRKYLSDMGYGNYFIHGLGHGVGLRIHELPTVSKLGTMTLEEGMVFTVEPGIYVAGRGGVRIEDTVILTKQGVQILNRIDKSLMEVI